MAIRRTAVTRNKGHGNAIRVVHGETLGIQGGNVSFLVTGHLDTTIGFEAVVNGAVVKQERPPVVLTVWTGNMTCLNKLRLFRPLVP